MRPQQHILLAILTILSALLLTVDGGAAYAQSTKRQHSIDEKDYILLITSYAHDSKQVVDFMQEFDDANNNDAFNLEVKIESLGIVTLDNCNDWHDNMVTIIRRQNLQYLKGVVIIGQEAWATYASLGDKRPDVPYFVTRVSEAGVTIPTEIENTTTWEPMSVCNQNKRQFYKEVLSADPKHRAAHRQYIRRDCDTRTIPQGDARTIRQPQGDTNRRTQDVDT